MTLPLDSSISTSLLVSKHWVGPYSIFELVGMFSLGVDRLGRSYITFGEKLTAAPCGGETK